MQQGSGKSLSNVGESSGNIKSISDLRECALKRLRALEAGKCDDVFLTDIDSFCKLSNNILNTLKVEISYLKTIDRHESVDFLESRNPKFIDHK
jgi:hypothetical protein